MTHLHNYELKVLSFLKGKKEATLEILEMNLDIERDSILWAVENLVKQGAVKAEDQGKDIHINVSKEGSENLEMGFPEERLVRALATAGGKASVANIKDNVGLSWAKRNGWIEIADGTVKLTKKGVAIAVGHEEYIARKILISLATGAMLADQDKAAVDALVKRETMEIKEKAKTKLVSITKKGNDLLATETSETKIGQMSREIIKNGTWKKKGFRSYDVNAPSEEVYPARLHPYREFANFLREKWIAMGFTEVSGPIVETAFWNFDALFSPQDHPTREMQDTFFLNSPKHLEIEDLKTMSKVKKMHEVYSATWLEDVAKQAVLRTHTTNVSVRNMKRIASMADGNYPMKMFSIGSVYRNENLDYKHLAELHQIDGMVVGDDLNLANLIDIMKTFYGSLGFNKIKIRPSYFPFTEPSLEVFYYNEEKGDFIELCGGGIIRKEITKAMGLDKTVLAWGMGVDRLMFNFMQLETLPTLFKNDVTWLRNRQNLKI